MGSTADTHANELRRTNKKRQTFSWGKGRPQPQQARAASPKPTDGIGGFSTVEGHSRDNGGTAAPRRYSETHHAGRGRRMTLSRLVLKEFSSHCARSAAWRPAARQRMADP